MRLPCPPGHCAMDSILRLLEGPWTSYVVWILNERGEQRFGALKRQVEGVSTRVLTARLRMLEETGLVARRVVATKVPQVSYALTARGRDVAIALRGLNALALRWQAEDARQAA